MLPWFAAVLWSTSQGAGPSSLSRSLGVQTQPVFGLCGFGPLETPWVEELTRGGRGNRLREPRDCTLGDKALVRRVLLWNPRFLLKTRSVLAHNWYLRADHGSQAAKSRKGVEARLEFSQHPEEPIVQRRVAAPNLTMLRTS